MLHKSFCIVACCLIMSLMHASNTLQNSASIRATPEPCRITVESKSRACLTADQIETLRILQLPFLAVYRQDDSEFEKHVDNAICGTGLSCCFLAANFAGADSSFLCCGLLAFGLGAKSICNARDTRKVRDDKVMRYMKNYFQNDYNAEQIQAFVADYKKELHEDYQAALQKAFIPSPQKQKMI